MRDYGNHFAILSSIANHSGDEVLPKIGEKKVSLQNTCMYPVRVLQHLVDLVSSSCYLPVRDGL